MEHKLVSKSLQFYVDPQQAVRGIRLDKQKQTRIFRHAPIIEIKHCPIAHGQSLAIFTTPWILFEMGDARQLLTAGKRVFLFLS